MLAAVGYVIMPDRITPRCSAVGQMIRGHPRAPCFLSFSRCCIVYQTTEKLYLYSTAIMSDAQLYFREETPHMVNIVNVSRDSKDYL